MNNCVALNIIADDKIVNKKGVPILLYWDGKTDIISTLVNDDGFIKYLMKNVVNTTLYTNTYISYFYFSEDEITWEEKYNENKISIQNFIPIEKLPNKDLAFEYVCNICIQLYDKAFQTPYKRTINSSKDVIGDIWSTIKSKYVNRVSLTTFTEYIRTELTKVDPELSQNNINYIIQLLKLTFK